MSEQQELIKAAIQPLTCEKCGGSRYYCKNCRCADCGNTFPADTRLADLAAEMQRFAERVGPHEAAEQALAWAARLKALQEP